jgi:hypothetical protein
MHIGHGYIRDRAYFVAGRHAQFRRKGDPTVESAIHDAENFLSTLPDSVQAPLISGGTTNQAKHVLVLTWLVQVGDAIDSITVAFSGYGRASARWPDRAGTLSQIDQLSSDELQVIDIPGLLAHYRPAAQSN